jgi:hypothetical protein
MEPTELLPLTDAEEAELQKEVDLAIAPYQKITPPKLLQQMRAKLEEGMRSHPVTRSLLRRVAARPQVDTSGEVRRDGTAEDDEAGGGEEGA